jgi:hypothetical protein
MVLRDSTLESLTPSENATLKLQLMGCLMQGLTNVGAKFKVKLNLEGALYKGMKLGYW